MLSTLSSSPVTFFYPYPDEIDRVLQLDLDDWRFWTNSARQSRRRVWVLRTYRRLHDAGYDVSLSPTLPAEGTVVLLPEDDIMHAFFDRFRPAHRPLFIVTIRADIIGFRSPLADVDIVQNGRFADDERTFFVPHWLQPGLIPRNPDRGDRIETITFKGGAGSLRDVFRSDTWHAFLREHNLQFRPDTEKTSPPRWHDYEEADLVLAVRPSFDDGGLRPEKPATKLYNAWHAGTPAILGPEYAFRELRESPLDYIEVDALDDAMQAIEFLLDHPARYRAMIEHGRRRAQAFTPERITERWAEVLFERLPEITKQSGVQWTRHLPLRARRLVNWLIMPPTPFELRKQLGHLYRTARSNWFNDQGST